MEFSGEKANSKNKQYAGGNWGHPRKFTKRHTNIEEIKEDTKRKPKKKKKEKKEYIWEGYLCPLCGNMLELKEQEKFYVIRNTEDSCKKCGAKKTECPCCHRETWVSKEGYHSHSIRSNCGCGFKGYGKVI